MKTCKIKWGIVLLIGILGNSPFLWSQASGELKWLKVGTLQTYFSEQGSEVESGADDPAGSIYFSWPADYGLRQSTMRAKALWLGCKNFYDVRAKKTFSVKVVGIGPRVDSDWEEHIFPVEFKLYGRYPHPSVVVDGLSATDNELYDVLDDVIDTLQADRMLYVKVNTALGVTVTKKVMAFSHPYHDNYFICDYVFKNTGIVTPDGTRYDQTLEDCFFYLQYRFAFSGESVTAYAQGWGTWDSTWGKNTLNYVLAQDPDPLTTPTLLPYRAFYSWYGPHSQRPFTNVQDDWGCPDEKETGVMAAAKYGGVIVLHADKSATDKTDDPSQPFTNNFLGSDDPTTQLPYQQFNETFMMNRYNVMTSGRPAKCHAEEVGEGYANEWGGDPGGYCEGLGFGPYTLAPGDSIHIVLAEGIAGINREKNREVGKNWLAWYNKTSTPPLVMPDGSTTTDHTNYKKAWVQTGIDSILQTFRRAIKNYQYLYQISPQVQIAQPPPPPSVFIVESGGNRIQLRWSAEPDAWPNFNGYVVYRSKGNVLRPETVYEKIFECDRSHPVVNGYHVFDDVTAQRGFVYYYCVQTKDDGSTNEEKPGSALLSSKFWTITNKEAMLLRPPMTNLDSIYIVPNPYDVRARALQFADPITGFDRDRIVFFGLPPVCKIRIYTERGDLIWEKDHTNGSGDDFWNSQTMYGQVVVSGIYIAYFETPDGKSAFRKFVVIR